MATIEQLLRTAAGEYFWVPWRHAIVGSPNVLTPPSFSGTPRPGQRLTWISGSYLPADGGTTFERFECIVRRASDNALLGFSIEPYYDIPGTFPACVIELIERRTGVAELPIEARVFIPVAVSPGAPQLAGAPQLTTSGGTVGATLTATDPAMSGSPAPTRQRVWKKDGAVVTGSGQTLVAGSVGVYTQEQTASNGTLPNAGPVVSNAITIVAASTTPQFSAAPTMSRNASGQYSAVNASVTSTQTTTVVNRWYIGDTANGPWTYRGSLTSDPNKWLPSEDYAGKFITSASFATNASTPAGVESPKATPIQIPAIPTEGFKTAAALTGAAPQGSKLTLAATYYGTPSETELYYYRVSTAGVVTELSTKDVRTTGPDDLGNDIKGRIRIKYSSGAEYWSPSETGFTTGIRVTPPVAWPALDGIAATGSNEGGNVLDKPYVRFNDAYSALVPENLWSNFYHHAGALAGYEAWRGNTACNAYLEGAVKKLLTKGNEPNIMMNYGAMYPFASCVMFYYASITPAVWAKFSTTQKGYIDAIMKLAAIAAAAVARDDSTDNHKSMTGEGGANATELSDDSNPNIRCPHYAFPQLLCAYMGASEADAFLSGVTEASIKALRDTVATALPRIGLAFKNTRPSNSPSWNKIVDKSANYSTGGLKLTDHAQILERELIHMYSEPVFLGLNDGVGSKQAPTTNANDRDDNYYRGRFTNIDRVKGLQAYKDIKDAIGMPRELNTGDGGGLRSSMSYHCFADTTMTLFPLYMFTSGLVSPSHSRMKNIRSRLVISQAFCKLADAEGYDSAAQNRTSGSGNRANSHDWKHNSTAGKRAMIPVRRSLAQLIIDKIPEA